MSISLRNTVEGWKTLFKRFTVCFYLFMVKTPIWTNACDVYLRQMWS